MQFGKWVLVVYLAAWSSLSIAQKAKKYEERKRDAYLAQPFELTSPPPGFLNRGATIVQVNTNGAGQNILNDAANEPSITVDPTNPNKIAVGWRQFDNIASNFRQGGFASSTDGGMTWSVGTLTPGLFRSDPVLDSTAGGIFHYNSLQQTFYSDEFLSNNGGMTWGTANPATGGDKQWIAIDKNPASPGFGFVHQWWSTAGNNYSGRQYSRSTNGGTTWMDPINVPQRPIWGTIAIDNNGYIYLGGTASGAPGLRVVRSTNARNSAVTPTFDSGVTPNMLGDLSNGLAINPGGLSGQVSCVADTGNGPTSGNIYLMASIVRSDNGNLDVIFSRSTNQGVTWSAPVKVNDDALGQGHFHYFATMSVAKNGRLDAIWLDTRDDPGKRMSKLMYSYSLDAGATWSANETLTGAFDPLIGWPNQNKIGDYMGIVSQNNYAQAIFPATFTGGQDVYFAKIDAPKSPLSGKLTLQDWAPTSAGQLLSFEITDGLGNSQTGSTVITAADGSYSIPMNQDFCHRNITVKVKASHWLRRTVFTGIVGLAGVNTGTDSAINGDTVSDNVIDLSDYTSLAAAFNAMPASPNWNAAADLNGDQIVDLTDYTIIAVNFNALGD